MRVRLKGINTVRRYRKDGSFAVYYYHRATGRQLTGLPGSAEFMASFGLAENALRERANGTIYELIRKFEIADEYRQFADTTRREYIRKSPPSRVTH